MFFKENIKKICIQIGYRGYCIKRNIIGPTVNVMSVDDTITELLQTDKSLVRFGDGEFLMIRGGNVHFQNVDKALSESLADIVGYRDDGLMVSVQDIFDGLDLYVPKSQEFWKEHLFFYEKYYRKLCNHHRVYASTSFSRSYITIADKSMSARWFDKIKLIWKGKDIVVVEGATTHNGVGNDLLGSARSIRRIICPSKNAYDKIDEIRKECFKMPEGSFFLVSLGPAAKPLVRDLYYAGHRAIDIGQLDSEYEMFLAGAEDKIDIQKHKLVTREENINAGFSEYLSQIAATVG